MTARLVSVAVGALAAMAVISAIFFAADAALRRPRLLHIQGAVASSLSADYSPDSHAPKLPPLDPLVIEAALADEQALNPEASPPRTRPTATPAPTNTPLPEPTEAPPPVPTLAPEPSPTDTPVPEPTATDTPEPEPTPTVTVEPTATRTPEGPKPTRTPDPCKTPAPWEDLQHDASEPPATPLDDKPCPSPTEYKTPYNLTPHNPGRGP
jgi:hypothetical protein